MKKVFLSIILLSAALAFGACSPFKKNSTTDKATGTGTTTTQTDTGNGSGNGNSGNTDNQDTNKGNGKKNNNQRVAKTCVDTPDQCEYVCHVDTNQDGDAQDGSSKTLFLPMDQAMAHLENHANDYEGGCI